MQNSPRSRSFGDAATGQAAAQYGRGAPITLDMVNGITMNGLSYHMATEPPNLWMKYLPGFGETDEPTFLEPVTVRYTPHRSHATSSARASALRRASLYVSRAGRRIQRSSSRQNKQSQTSGRHEETVQRAGVLRPDEVDQGPDRVQPDAGVPRRRRPSHARHAWGRVAKPAAAAGPWGLEGRVRAGGLPTRTVDCENPRREARRHAR